MNFHLYLVLPQNIPEGEKFFLVTAKYCLLYTQGEAPEGAKEIKKISTLPRLAKEWLAGCIDQIREKALEEEKDQLLNVTGPAFYAAFEEALKAERGRHGSEVRQQATGNRQQGTDSSATADASAQNDGDGGERIATGPMAPRNDRDGRPMTAPTRRAASDRPYGNDMGEKEDGEA